MTKNLQSRYKSLIKKHSIDDLDSKETQVLYNKIDFPQKKLEQLSGQEIQGLVNNLQLHQIELEMQNEALILSQQKLEESNQRYLALYNHAPVCFCTLDKSDNIIGVNQTFVKFIGLSEKQLKKITLHDLVFQEDQDKFYLFNKQRLKTPQISRTELRLNKADQQAVWGQLSAIEYFDGDGNPVTLIGIVDITERKQSEAQLFEIKEQRIHATKMESLGYLTSGIAHDFNNILAGIMGYTQLAQITAAKGESKLTSGHLAKTLSATNRARALIEQMSSFSKQSTAEVSKPKATKLTPVIQEAVPLIRPSIAETIKLNLHILDNELEACVEPLKLQQIILNLAINAHEAMGQNGSVDIVLSTFNAQEILCNSCHKVFSGEFAQITIQDSGPGIPESILDKVFLPFFTSKNIGKGMGLSVVHGLVHAHGGHIYIDTDNVTGGKINILFPIAHQKQPLSCHQVKPAVQITGCKIMVVDDEELLVDMLSTFLSMHGAIVTTYTDPAEALADFANAPSEVDLVITDQSMPGICGMDLAKEMLEINKQLPIILCTGYSEQATPETTRNMGIAGFFNKPAQLNQVLDKIIELWQS